MIKKIRSASLGLSKCCSLSAVKQKMSSLAAETV